jgi:16S rRNA processing protein RimM
MADTYDPRTIAIGVLGKPHGVQGEIALRLFNLETPSLADLSSVILDRGGQRTTRVVTRSRPFGKGFLVTFAGISSRAEAAALTLSRVRIERTALPAPGPGEFFVADIIGCQVLAEDGLPLGVVAETFWNGAHDIMIVRGPAEPDAAGDPTAAAAEPQGEPDGGQNGGQAGEQNSDEDAAAPAPAESAAAEVVTPEREHLIPLVPDFVREVDVPGRTIRVAWVAWNVS